MPELVRQTRGFPTLRIPSRHGRPPVEVCVVAQLGPGAGNSLFTSASSQQRKHASFVDALDEPSAKLFGINLDHADATSMYSFAVDAKGHPFHRHAGHRMFTAVSGSAGAQLRFSTVPDDVLQADPAAFESSLHYVDIAPDSLFVVRFGGGTWHQFSPLQPDSTHPVFFALSCHTNELGGIADPGLIEDIHNNGASIPSLTQLLPESVRSHLQSHPIRHDRVQTSSLALHAPPRSIAARMCSGIRNAIGRMQRRLAAMRTPSAFVGSRLRHRARPLDAVPADSLLSRQFEGEHCEHEDLFGLTVPADEVGARPPQGLLSDVLEGFLENRPAGVSWLMRLRNILVRPLRLRTSPLGCPVSSLLSEDRTQLFAGRFPVLDMQLSPHGAEVLLGADDRHLRFRSCVGIRLLDDGSARITLGTRVQCRNLFGRVYLRLIDRTHREYITPTMLEMAAAHAIVQQDHLFPACSVAS